MTIKKRMTLLSVLVALLGISALLIQHYALNTQENLKNGDTLLAHIQSDILMLRRHEKDFLMRNDLKYVQRFEQSFQQTQIHLNLLKQLIHDHHLPSDTLPTLITALDNYRESFTALVTATQQVGMNEKTGLQGALREAVHRIEQQINQLDNLQLLKDTLMLRRREKDFLLRMDMKYLESFEKDVLIFEKNLANSSLSEADKTAIHQLLQQYHRDFTSMVKGYQTLGLNSDEGLKGKMRLSVHTTDEALQTLDLLLANALKERMAFTATLSWVLVMLLSAVVIVLAIASSRSIQSSILRLSQAIQRVDQTNDLSLRADCQIQDETRSIARSFNNLLANMQTTINEANRVVTAIAQGDFQQRIELPLQGDLATLKTGVNNSASSVSFMMSELGTVMQSLHQGRFDIQMDPHVPTAFRNQVESALNSIQTVINQINHVMDKVDHGNFNERVTIHANGDLHTLKTCINESLDKLEHTFADISHVVSGQATGNLTLQSTYALEGQLKQLQEAMNTSADIIKTAIANGIYAARTVHEASDQVSQSAINLSARIQEQASAMTQSNQFMQQISSTVHDNTEHAQNAANMIAQIQAKATSGVDVMKQTINAMQSIQQSSNHIADIVSLIDGIAFQTNLLALNAAVEAARAGEHGRGFAVVAGEVRALAQKSADAAKDIKQLIEDSVTRIQKGTELANQSGIMLTQINNAIEEANDMIQQIAEASKQQSSGIAQAHNAMKDIERVIQESAALIEETSAAAESMNQEAKELQNNMAFFYTGQDLPTADNHLPVR